MKTKIAILLIAVGVVASFGATKIKTTKSEQKSEFQTSSTQASQPKGGFVSEEH